MYTVICLVNSKFRSMLFASLFFIASLFVAAVAAPSAYAETSGVVWGNVYGGSEDDGFYDVVSLDDGGTIAVGGSESIDSVFGWSNVGGEDAIAVRFDAEGAVLWAQNYGGARDDCFYAAATDGAYLYAVGRSIGVSTNMVSLGAPSEWSHNALDDALYVKIDIATGTPVFGCTMGGSGGESFQGVALTNTGNVCLLGTSNGVSSNLITEFGAPAEWANYGESDGIALEIDANNKVVWAKNYGGSRYDTFESACSIPGTNGVYVAGFSTSAPNTGNLQWGNEGGADGIVLKIRTAEPVPIPGHIDGYPAWTKNYDGTGDDFFEGIAADDTSLYLVGSSDGASVNLSANNWGNLGDDDMVVVKVAASDGLPEWAYNYGGVSDDAAYAVTVAPEGSVYIAGESKGYSENLVAAGAPEEWSNQGSHDAIVLKLIPSTAEIDWAVNCGGSDTETVRSICATPKSEAVAAFVAFNESDNIVNLGAPSEWGSYGGADALVIKLASRFTLDVVQGTDVLGAGLYFSETSVPIKANAAPSGEMFNLWSSDAGGVFAQVTDSDTTFIMPAADTIVTASYKKKPAPGPTPKPTPPPTPSGKIPPTGDSFALFAVCVSLLLLSTAVLIARLVMAGRIKTRNTHE